MRVRTLPGVLALAACAILPLPSQAAAPGACRAPAGADHELLGDRGGELQRLQEQPRECLEQMFRVCSQAAGTALLDFGSAAACSLSYEALLQKHFAGDFQALMAWWRSERAAG